MTLSPREQWIEMRGDLRHEPGRKPLGRFGSIRFDQLRDRLRLVSLVCKHAVEPRDHSQLRSSMMLLR